MKGFFVKSKTCVFHLGEQIIGNNSLAITHLSQTTFFLSHDAMRKRVRIFFYLLLFILNSNVANVRLQYCSIKAKFVAVIEQFHSNRNCSLWYDKFMIKIKLKLIVNCKLIIPYNFSCVHRCVKYKTVSVKKYT